MTEEATIVFGLVFTLVFSGVVAGLDKRCPKCRKLFAGQYAGEIKRQNRDKWKCKYCSHVWVKDREDNLDV